MGAWHGRFCSITVHSHFFSLTLAHPSCMDYSIELTARIRADGGSWQCIDCKACVMCQDSGDPVSHKKIFIYCNCSLLLINFTLNSHRLCIYCTMYIYGDGSSGCPKKMSPYTNSSFVKHA